MKLMKAEIKNLGNFLKKSDNIIKKIQQLYSRFPSEIKQYIDPIDMSDEDYIAAWCHIPYQGKTIPEYIPVENTLINAV